MAIERASPADLAMLAVEHRGGVPQHLIAAAARPAAAAISPVGRRRRARPGAAVPAAQSPVVGAGRRRVPGPGVSARPAARGMAGVAAVAGRRGRAFSPRAAPCSLLAPTGPRRRFVTALAVLRGDRGRSRRLRASTSERANNLHPTCSCSSPALGLPVPWVGWHHRHGDHDEPRHQRVGVDPLEGSAHGVSFSSMPWMAIDDAVPKPSITAKVRIEQTRVHPWYAIA